MERPIECRGCPLDKLGYSFSHPTGTGVNGVLIVGEALGHNEAQEGRPFVEWADAGSVLQKAIQKAGYSRDQFGFWNIVGCQPPDNKLEGERYEIAAVNHCKIHFDRVVAMYKPRVLLALGNTATKWLTGLSGKHKTINSLRGYVLPCARYPELLVVASYHPSFLRRGAMKLFRVLVQDVDLAVQTSLGEYNDYILNPTPPVGFNMNPTLDDARGYLRRVRDNLNLEVAYDIETDRSMDEDESEIFTYTDDEEEEEELESSPKEDLSPIFQIQFSVGLGDAIVFPWRIREFREVAFELLATPNRKLGHNIINFDNPRIRREGARINGVLADSMNCWHHYQPDLPAHLQFVASFFGQPFPWKHLGAQDIAFYGGMDVEAEHRIWSLLPDHMRCRRSSEPFSVNVYEGYKQHVEKLTPMLEAMSRRGIPINNEERVKFGLELDHMKEDLYAQLDGIYPTTLRPAKQKEGLVKMPKAVAEEIVNQGGVLPSGPTLGDIYDKTGYLFREFEADVPIVEEYTIKCGCKKGCKKCGGFRVLTKSRKTDAVQHCVIGRWYEPKPFKPSYAQVSAYILNKKHKMPRRVGGKKTEKGKPSTGKLGLLQLFKSTKDVFYKLVVDYRNVEKLRGTYVDGWAPQADGRVHTSYTFRPATQQLSSTKPNVHNAVGEKGGELGLRFKRCIEARPGRVLQEFDYTGLHSYMLGYLAKDRAYMRLSRFGIHDYVAAHILSNMLGEGLTDETMRNYALAVDSSKAGEYNHEMWALLEETLDRLRDLTLWIDLDDETLATKLKWIKKSHGVFRSKVKPAVHGYGFGLGAQKLKDTNPDSIRTRKEAQELLDMLNRLFPLVAKYKNDIREVASRQSYLITPYGAIRHFHDVYKRQAVKDDYIARPGEQLYVSKSGNRFKMAPGQDSEKVIAYLPAACSFGYKKDAMLRVAETGLDDLYHLINEIHDSLLFENLVSLVDRAREDVLAIMQHPSRCLRDPDMAPNGLICYAEMKMGRNWGELN